jgi:methylmalonyl-CoA carboxyltransferase small subunit
VKLRLTVDGKVFEVDVEILSEDPAPRGRPRSAGRGGSGSRPETGASASSAGVGAAPIAGLSGTAEPARGGGSEVGDESKVLRSPMSGVVVKVPVAVGQHVEANEVVIVLEAMKMETVIAAKAAGKVCQVCAGVGDAVVVEQVLVEFE